MSTDTVSPLRQRMIEDMNARKLCAGTQRGHISSCKRFAAFVKRFPDTATLEDIRRFQLHLAETGVSICNRNRIMTGLRFLVPRDAAAAGSCRRDLSHPRAAEDPAGDEPGRDAAPAGRRQQPQGSHTAQSRLWLRVARRRGGPAQDQAYRQRAEDHSHRAVQGPQGPQCHAVVRDARSVAAMVEGAPVLARCGNAPGRTLAVSRPPARQADDDPPTQPPVP